MPIRNPFRRAGAPEATDDSPRNAAENGFKDATVSGAKPLQMPDSAEYKLSEINDSGVYLPPSPHQEKPAFWHSKSNTSTTSSNHRSLLADNEPFSISRESFDSYRRSFDISARSPIDCGGETYPRQSLDARRSVDTRRSLDVRRSRATPRSSMQQHRESTDQVPEEGFEEVGLNDEPKPQPQKKRGLFARFGDNNHADEKKQEDRPPSSHHFSLTGRKRAESGGGAELKPMPRQSTEVPVETRS
ncbi:hypothetical protein FB567DRAFT_41721 [Paraphoma chrysanthemicola]|uniref:Uncharacterized protein n=1 Tax=Paraphoma chrysanthemicola TaxID=798071 RepID=A0A8K0RM29_9PLEO|nr:hypothetical protein FB567DRAFT_41721 [Paraphoma chrysanthemicola]